MFNLPGGSIYEIYKLATIVYLLPPDKLNINNMTLFSSYNGKKDNRRLNIMASRYILIVFQIIFYEG